VDLIVTSEDDQEEEIEKQIHKKSIRAINTKQLDHLSCYAFHFERDIALATSDMVTICCSCFFASVPARGEVVNVTLSLVFLMQRELANG